MAHYELACSKGNTKFGEPECQLHFTLKYKGYDPYEVALGNQKVVVEDMK